MIKVMEQPTRVREEDATPPRVERDKAMSKVVEQSPRVREEAATPPSVDGDIIAKVPRFSKQECEADTPARKTRSQRRTLAQEVIYSFMKITSTPATPKNLASRKFPMKLLCKIAGAVLDGSTGELHEYRHLRINPQYRQVWGKSFGDEIGRFAQGIPNRVDGTDTMFFINENKIPNNRRRDVTYRQIVCDVRERKAEKNRTRLTVGGNRINYPGDAGTPTACLLTVKLLVNSVVSTAGAEFMTLHIKLFYLDTPLARYEYLRLKLSNLTKDIIEQFVLKVKK